MELIYKPIPGFDHHYTINQFGQIYTTYYNWNRHITPRINNSGYLLYRIRKNGDWKYSNYTAHRLVMLAFYGDQPDKEVNHKDGNKINNYIGNLEYCTKSENHLHKCNVLGKKPVGTKGKTWKVSKESFHS